MGLWNFHGICEVQLQFERFVSKVCAVPVNILRIILSFELQLQHCFAYLLLDGLLHFRIRKLSRVSWFVPAWRRVLEVGNKDLSVESYLYWPASADTLNCCWIHNFMFNLGYIFLRCEISHNCLRLANKLHGHRVFGWNFQFVFQSELNCLIDRSVNLL